MLNVVCERVPDRLALRGRRPDREPAPPIELLGLAFQPYVLRRGRGPGDVRLPFRWLGCELLTALLYALAWDNYGRSSTVIPVLVLFTTIVPATVIDLRVLRIPDRIVFPGLLLTSTSIVAVSIQKGVPAAILGAAIGGLTYFVALFIPHLVYPRGMGFGDVKFALVLGSVIGWLAYTDAYPIFGPVRLVLYALIAGLLSGVVFGLVSPMVRRGEAFPLGPGLALGAVYVVLQAFELRI
jgi:leader peptidase (prepilin peptidase)/N-methyltransferase